MQEDHHITTKAEQRFVNRKGVEDVYRVGDTCEWGKPESAKRGVIVGFEWEYDGFTPAIHMRKPDGDYAVIQGWYCRKVIEEAQR